MCTEEAAASLDPTQGKKALKSEMNVWRDGWKRPAEAPKDGDTEGWKSRREICTTNIVSQAAFSYPRISVKQ